MVNSLAYNLMQMGASKVDLSDIIAVSTPYM